MRYQLLTLLLSLAFVGASGQTKNFLDQPYIEVNGNADTAVTPDEIYIRITLSERDTRDRVPLEEQERKMAESFRSLGIDIEKDLSTTDLLSNYTTYFLRGKEVVKTQTYLLKVSTADMAGRVFAKLEELDLSNAAIDHVDHSDLEGIRNRMRSAAIANARTRAVALTRPLSQAVGGALLITDNENYNTPDPNARVQIRGYA
ncbi:MAG: DUF541 domain-containing protein, partial [Chitinophagaceae bacterium]